MLGNYVTPLGYGNIPADLSYNNVVNATDGLYFLRLAGVVQASTTGFLEANLTPAYGSTYGTKKVGLGFSVGTNSQALRVGAGLSDQGYMNNVNGVIFGYMGSGPRIIASDYDFDDDTPNTIRIVASETYFPVGLVGIGTTSPGYQLDVIASANLAARFRSTAGNHSVVTIDTQDAVTYSPYLQFSRNGTMRFTIQAWQATDRLNIVDGDSNDGVYLAQNATSWVSNSDARLKDVTGTITNALDKVNQLTGVMFTWKRDVGKPDAKTRVGLLAQDVQAAFPEAVDDDHPDILTDAETGKLSGGIGVRYTEIVPLLVNAIKELTTRIATLEQRV